MVRRAIATTLGVVAGGVVLWVAGAVITQYERRRSGEHVRIEADRLRRIMDDAECWRVIGGEPAV